MTVDEFLARFDDVEEEDDGVVARCPAHADGHPSLRVAVSDRGRVIVKCRAGCETEDVLRAVGLTIRDLATMEPGTFAVRARGADVPASEADVAALAARLDRYARHLTGWLDAEEPIFHDARREVFSYACQRFGLNRADVERLGLGYADDLGGGPRLVVPFRDRAGVPRGFQARALEKDAAVRWLGPRNPDGASWAKVGWLPGASRWSEVIVTEGPGDGLTANAVGYDVVLIRGAGLASSPDVQDAVAELVGEGVAVVAGDNDESGRRFAETLTAALVARGKVTRRLVLPDGVGDLTAWRESHPAKHLFGTELARAVGEAPETRPTAPREAILLWGPEFAESATDVAGARLLRDLMRRDGTDARFSPEAGFYLLDSGVWRLDRLDHVRTFAHKVSDELRSWLSQAEPPKDKDTPEAKAFAALSRYARHAQTTRGIDSMIRELQALDGVAIDQERLDAHPDLLACRNGVVNLRTGELLPHDPDLLLTRRVDLDYRSDARAPRWERFLEEVFERYGDLPAYVRRLVGYGITGRTDEQCFAVLYGTGANGKSIFTDTLTAVFRELTVTTPFSTFEERSSGGIPNDLAALKGARLVMAAEGEQGRPMAEAVLKRVTGRDLISARFMRREFFEFRPTFLLLLATNFRPQFRGQDEGLWRRVKLVPWDRYFRPEERDHHLGGKLLDEAEGIFAWAVRGAVEWYSQGLADPDVIRKGTAEYRETSDALAGFLPGVFVKDRDAVTTGRVLWDQYCQWTDDEGLPLKERWTRKALFAALEERGLAKRKRAEGVVFVGVRRARQADAVPDHDLPEDGEDRAPAEAPADSSRVPQITAGASLDDVL